MAKEQKRIENFSANCKDYYNKYTQLVGNVKTLIDLDCIKNISIPYDTNLYNLDYEIFSDKIKDTFLLPISNDKFEQLFFCEKRVINKVDTKFNKEDNLFTQGMYLLGRDINSKPILYSFSLSINKDYPQNFSIKLYAVVKGKHKMLLRLDSDGFDHPVYVKNGNIVSSNLDKIDVATPHIHVASQEMEVIAQNDKSYSHAYYVGDKINKEQSIKDGTYLNKCMEYMLNLINLKTNLNYENLNNITKSENAFDVGSIFDEQTFIYGENVNKLNVFNNGILRDDVNFKFTQLIKNYNFSTRNLTKTVEMAKVNIPKSNRVKHKEYNEKNR